MMCDQSFSRLLDSCLTAGTDSVERAAHNSSINTYPRPEKLLESKFKITALGRDCRGIPPDTELPEPEASQYNTAANRSVTFEGLYVRRGIEAIYEFQTVHIE